jgi:hypothetical protein
MGDIRVDRAINAISQDSMMNYAVKNVQQQMGSLKSNKEVKTQDEAQTEVRDMVELGLTPKQTSESEHLDAAQHAGVISEFTPKTKKKETKDKERVELGVRTEVNKDEDKGKVEIAKAKKEVEKVELENKVARIKSDIPAEVYEAAKKIVEGQIDVRTNEPTKSLKSMKPIPETGALEMKAVAYHPIMDIHDNDNMPMASMEN